MRLTKTIIDTKYLKTNYLNIRNKANNRKVMAVVKADAYGHGIETVVKSLNSLGKQKPEYYAVATADEGIELRKLKIKQPILIFDPIDKYQVKKFFKFNLIPSVFTNEHIKILLREKKRLKIKKKFLVHIKIDTGMNRLGVDYFESIKFFKELSLDENFRIDGIYTHFATSDEAGSSYAKLQIQRFNEVIRSLQRLEINYGLVHAANSGAIIDFPKAYYDMVRPGISLYGYYPSLKTLKSIKLYPVMSLISKVSSIKVIKKGESVSYSRRYFAKKDTKIISVPVGYADGFPRALTNKAKAIINNKVYNQIGTITMDRIMFDIGNDKIKINDDVILLGRKGKLKIDAWDWSKIINTIPYEVTCGISKRVPRVIK
jgi:alanine racemase